MSIKIPNAFMGKPVKGSIERALAAAQLLEEPATPPAPHVPRPTTSINDPQNYIVLPARTHGTYSYAGTLVAMDKTHHNKNWSDSHTLLADEGSYMPTIRQFVDFITLLKSGNAFDGRGNIVPKPKLDDILDDILTVKSPWRSEWLDAQFESHGGVIGIGSKMCMNYEHRVVNGVLTPQHPRKELNNYLTSNKTPGIDLDTWLANANEYGLPANISSGDLYYWAPTNGRVAGFVAYSGWAGLGCDGDPADCDGGLGVRACRAP